MSLSIRDRHLCIRVALEEFKKAPTRENIIILQSLIHFLIEHMMLKHEKNEEMMKETNELCRHINKILSIYLPRIEKLPREGPEGR